MGIINHFPGGAAKNELKPTYYIAKTYCSAVVWQENNTSLKPINTGSYSNGQAIDTLYGVGFIAFYTSEIDSYVDTYYVKILSAPSSGSTKLYLGGYITSSETTPSTYTSYEISATKLTVGDVYRIENYKSGSNLKYNIYGPDGTLLATEKQYYMSGKCNIIAYIK